MDPITFAGYTLTEEEANILSDTLNKIREEKRKNEIIQKNETYLKEIAESMIDAVGMAETKRIFRKVTRSLRDATED